MCPDAVKEEVRVMYLTRDAYPTFRVDIDVLFGKYLSRLGLSTTIVARQEGDKSPGTCSDMPTILHSTGGKGRYLKSLSTLFADLGAVFQHAGGFDVVQVRNKIFTAAVVMWIARYRGAKFSYWMSYPYPEDDILRVSEQGLSLGLVRAALTWLRGHLSRILLYRFVIPASDHVFLQSDQMLKDVAAKTRLDPSRVTVVPMGIDLEEVERRVSCAVPDVDGRMIAYLGAMERARRLDFVFEALAHVLSVSPDVYLVLIGDCIEESDWRWLESKASSLGVRERVIKTGWLQRDAAWSYLEKADLGLCALPDRFVFNSMSPTKAVEMLALSLPVVVTEHPDQGALVRESGGGLVTPYDPEAFGEAILKLLNDPSERAAMAKIGNRYVAETRSYEKIARGLYRVYSDIAAKRLGDEKAITDS